MDNVIWGVKCHSNEQWKHLAVLPETMTIYVCIISLFKWTNWSKYHKHRLQTQIWRNRMSETSSIQTKRNRQQYCTVKLIKWVRQVTFFNVKIEKFVGANLSHFQCLACWVVEFNYKCPFNTGCNNRNDHFRYFLGVRVRLIEVSA